MKLYVKSGENTSEESETFNTFEVSNISHEKSKYLYIS